MKSRPGEFYKTFKPFLSNNNKDETNTNISLKVNDKVERDQSQVVEIFADYFATIAAGIGGDNVEHLKEADLQNHTSIETIRNAHEGVSFEFKPFEILEVQRTLENIDVKKSPGWDGMSPKVLKITASSIAPALTNLYNNCISLGQWPKQWKKGEWIPVHKHEDRQDRRNYRPITTLIAVDKIFELLLSRQVTEHYDHQFYYRMTAYRKKNSCETTMIRLVEDWKMAVDNRELVSVLSMDMSKAFDSLCPALVIQKLKAYGFGNQSLNLMRSFFHQRMNRVKLAGITSTWKETERGCPQGSSFGPLLWNIFQNDMSFNVKSSNLSMYADDHQLYTTGNNIEMVKRNLEAEAEVATSWYRDNFLLANPDKFQVITINPRRRGTGASVGEISLRIDGHSIEPTSEIKLLGVLFDDNLTFTRHISDVCRRSSQKVGVLMRLRNLIPCKSKLLLYKTIILPNLTYCHLVWHFCKASDRRKLERIQERALRAVYKSNKTSYENLLKQANLPSLYNRRLQDIAITMYKVKNGMTSTGITELFDLKGKKYNLRNGDFNMPRFDTIRYGKHSLRYTGPYIWSKLCSKDKNKPSLSSFKHNIRNIDIASLVEDGCNSCELCAM